MTTTNRVQLLRMLLPGRRVAFTAVLGIGLLVLWCGSAETQELDGDMGRPQYRHAEEVNSAIEEVMSAREYRRLLNKEGDGERRLPEWLRKFLEKLFGPSSRSSGMSGTPVALQGLFYIIVAIILVIVIALIVIAIFNRRSSSQDLDAEMLAEGSMVVATTPPGEQPAEEYLQRALELARGGDFRGGVRMILLGAMSWIERGGMIRFQKGLTNRDYIRAVWRQPRPRQALTDIVCDFEYIFFGRRSATRASFDACVQRLKDGFINNTSRGNDGQDEKTPLES